MAVKAFAMTLAALAALTLAAIPAEAAGARVLDAAQRGGLSEPKGRHHTRKLKQVEGTYGTYGEYNTAPRLPLPCKQVVGKGGTGGGADRGGSPPHTPGWVLTDGRGWSLLQGLGWMPRTWRSSSTCTTWRDCSTMHPT